MGTEQETSLLNQGKTGLSDGIERRIEAGRATRWRPGQKSPNPSGRPKEDPTPISNAYRRVLKSKIPKGTMRTELEKHLGKLPAKATFLDALATAGVFGVFGMGNFKVNVARELREAIEGREAPREFEPRGTIEEGETADGPIDNREHILLGFLRVIKKRAEIYGIEDPALKELEKEAEKEAGLAD